MTSERTDWSKMLLPLERPYKEPNGAPVRKLVDISNEEEFIYELPKSVDEQLGTRLQRIFEERGNTIWDDYTPEWAETSGNEVQVAASSSEDNDDGDEDGEDDDQEIKKKKPMNVEELAKLRADVVPTLMQALNELMISRDVLGVYLRAALPTAPVEGITPELLALPSRALASTTVTKPPSLPSVQAFNAQVCVGTKDEALRKSAAAFKTAATSMRRALASGERYWKDALKARNASWSLVAAPHAFGALTRKASDNNALDICISYGLEHAADFRRQASIVWLNSEEGKGPVAQGARKPVWLCVFIEMKDSDGSTKTSRNTCVPIIKELEDESVEEVLQDLQREGIDREIYEELVGNVSGLATAPAWVHEQAISVEISPMSLLKFELIPQTELEPSPIAGSDPAGNAVCDAIYQALRLLILRLHAFHLEWRQAMANKFIPPPRPVLLQGIVELFQYFLFVKKLEGHLNTLVEGMQMAGVEMMLRFNRLGSTAEELIALLATNYAAEESRKKSIGGEVVLHIAKRQTIRFTLRAPSLMKAFLAQTTSDIHSMSQLDELLRYEVNRSVLQRISDIGRGRTPGQGPEAWYVDVVASTCVGTWDENVVHFKLSHREGWRIECKADVSIKGGQVTRKKFTAADGGIFDWATSVIQGVIET